MSSDHDYDHEYEELQATDATDVDTAVDNIHEKNVEKQQAKQRIEHESKVRRLLTETRKALAGDSEFAPEQLLLTLHWHVRQHPDLPRVLAPNYGDLDDQTQLAFQDHMDLRDRGESPANPKHEFKTLARVAKELRYVHSVTDTSQYAPVRYEPIDADMEPVDVLPFGRRRYSHDSHMTREEAALEVPIKPCDHQLTMAQPRRGKDSTNVRCAGNLKDDHGYKWVSLLDDGRNETVMIAIPSDDPGIRKSLDRVGQQPKAYPAKVYIPNMGDIPRYLPNNFERFTFSTDHLTPELILRLVGITSTNSNTDRRIKTALDETVRAGGSVADLCDRLREYAEESEATIEVVELKDDPDNPGDATEDVERITYSMDEDKALRKAAEQLAMLAGEGLIASPNAATNLDVHEMVADQDTVAVLNANFLDSGDKGLKYTIMDMWAQLIFQARDESSRLPRVALEIREIKSIAPSKLTDTKYKQQIKPLRQSIFFLATQGGSRGVMMLGSTQKLTDMYKSVRSNMAIHVILNLSPEGINELDDKHDFRQEERQQIKEFNIGQGMIASEGKLTYPIEFAGARCGLGDKDREWIDRYGIAYGARVREGPPGKRIHTKATRGWPTDCDADYWISVKDQFVHEVDVAGKPDLGEWFLLPRDIEGLTPQDLLATPHAPVVDDTPPSLAPEDLDDVLQEHAELNLQLPEVVVRAGMVHRQEFVNPNDLMLKPTGIEKEQRSLTIASQDDETDDRVRQRLKEHDVPRVLWDWVDDESRDYYIALLEAVEDNECTNHEEIAEASGLANGTISNYNAEPSKTGRCVEKTDGVYELTPIGEAALETDWSEIIGDS